MNNGHLLAILPEAVADLYGHDSAHGFGVAAFGAAAFGTGTSADVACSLVQGVAVIRIRGALAQSGYVSPWSGQRLATGYDAIRTAIASALADPAARAILLAINSPGGAVAGCKELADFVAEATRQKPCAAYADGLCASAAYWLASATGRVFAPVTAQVGSIGILLVHADVSRLNEKMGVAYSTITGGEWKAVGNENEPLSPEARAMLQQRVNGLHTVFRADVASHMNLDPATARAWGEGQLFLAQDAAGLVTHVVPDLSGAVNTLAQETIMDRNTFEAQHPDLLAQIEAEAREKALADLKMQTATAALTAPDTGAQARAEILDLVGVVLGTDARAKIEGMSNVGITAAQFAALAPFLKNPEAGTPPTVPLNAVDAEAASRAAILAAMQNAHATPVALSPGTLGAAATSTISPLLADANRRAAAAK